MDPEEVIRESMEVRVKDIKVHEDLTVPICRLSQF